MHGHGEAKTASNARYIHSDTPSYDAPHELAFLFDSIIFFWIFLKQKHHQFPDC